MNITRTQYNQVSILTACMGLFTILNALLGNPWLGALFLIPGLALAVLLLKARPYLEPKKPKGA